MPSRVLAGALLACSVTVLRRSPMASWRACCRRSRSIGPAWGATMPPPMRWAVLVTPADPNTIVNGSGAVDGRVEFVHKLDFRVFPVRLASHPLSAGSC